MHNPLKSALAIGDRQIGLWCSLASPIATEALSFAGFDWLLVDGEHSPNDMMSILHQHQVASGSETEIVVRTPNHDPNLIKQYLDLGLRSLLIPNVQTASEAQALVAATRYPPEGIRGFSVSQRANRYGRVRGYHANAYKQIFLALQIETSQAVANATEIAAVAGVDAIFVGPGDLSADAGAMGNPNDPEVQKLIESVIRLSASGTTTGILTPNQADALRYIEWGARMVAVGSDLGLLVRSADALAANFKAPLSS